MSQPLWDPDVLSRIRRLHLRARHLTESLLMGAHRSRRVGQAVEFADYQEYVAGMDVRRLDWRVWARSDRHVIRRFETETELPCTVIVDLSGDLGTGEEARGRALPDLEGTKAGYAITMAATLLYFLHRHGEPVGLELVAGEGMTHRSMPPRGGRNHLQTLFATLAVSRPAGRADLADALARVGPRVRRRSFVAVISDGMEEPSRWLPSLGALARRGADTRFFHIRDPKEWTLGFSQPALFFSPEGGEVLPVDPQGASSAFAEVVAEYEEEVRAGVVRWGGTYLPVDTSGPMERALRSGLLGLNSSPGRPREGGAWA